MNRRTTGAAQAAPAPRCHSGPNLTEERRAELGQRRLQLRIGERALGRLDALCEASGFSRSEQVEALIDAENR